MSLQKKSEWEEEVRSLHAVRRNLGKKLGLGMWWSGQGSTQ
jgi:hypothetical protein